MLLTKNPKDNQTVIAPIFSRISRYFYNSIFLVNYSSTVTSPAFAVKNA